MTEIITLGGRGFELRPLTLGQLRPVLDALDGMAGKSGGALIEAAAEIVAAGLAPSHPEIGVAAVLDLEATIEELNAAVAAVLRVAGLQPQGGVTGEAETPDGRTAAPGMTVPQPAASDLPLSMPPSPPAAASPIA